VLLSEPALVYGPSEIGRAQPFQYVFSQEVESLNHLFVGCSYSREIWFKCLRRMGLRQLTPLADDNLLEWRLRSRKRTAKARRKAFDSFVFLVTWHLWLERNARLFRIWFKRSLYNVTCGVELVQWLGCRRNQNVQYCPAIRNVLKILSQEAPYNINYHVHVNLSKLK
jgi:hypothetical protein